MHDVRRLCWAAAITGEPRYVEGASRWTMAWVRALPPSGNDVNDNKLDALLLASLLLRDHLSADDRRATIAWCRTLGAAHSQGFDAAVGNRMAKRVKLVAAAALITGDAALLDVAADRFRHFISAELRPDGGSRDLELRDALSYHCSALKSMLEASLVLRRAGVDLYAYEAPSGSSLRRSVALVRPYALGEKVHPEWLRSTVDLDRRRWEAGDPYYKPGKLWDPLSAIPLYRLVALHDREQTAVLQHLRQRKGVELSWEEVTSAANR